MKLLVAVTILLRVSMRIVEFENQTEESESAEEEFVIRTNGVPPLNVNP